jgi:beta-glucanase (GH16 family)
LIGALARLVAAIALIIGAAAAPAMAAAPAQPPTWSDEFNGTELDMTRWSHRATGVRHDGILTPDAVSVGEGALKITTYTRSGTHYSGMIGTQRHDGAGFEQTYGYFEARVKFNSTQGQWSAFWLQTPTNGNPLGDPATAGVEMDIAEHRARCPRLLGDPPPPPVNGPPPCFEGDASHRIQQALVWDGYAPGTSKAAVSFTDVLPGLGNGSWHTWALRWSPTGLTFYYDDAETWSQSGPISRRSQYLILSSEVGEYFAGTIPADGYGTREESATDMQVDYVRVWALAPVNTTAPALTGTPALGEVLACSTGDWGSDATPAFGVEWLSDGAVIAGAAAAGYTVRSADRGHALSCRVTATTAAGSASAVSNELAVPAPPPPPVLARPVVVPPPPAPLPPPPAVDRAAPAATLSGAVRQKLAPTVAVTIACADEACQATSSGTVRVPRIGRTKAKTHRLAARTTLLARGGRATVRLTLSRTTRRAIARALRARRQIVVTLTVLVADRAGNRRTLKRRVTLRR